MGRGDAKAFFEFALAYEGDECLFWPFSRRPDGRAQMANRPGVPVLVHRHLCEKVNGSPPTPKHEAAHSCGNGHLGCVAKRHISWKTSKENKADQLIHGTRPIGEKHGMAKLTDEQVIEIRKLKGAMFQREVAEMFGVSQQAVQLIQAGKRRKDHNHG